MTRAHPDPHRRMGELIEELQAMSADIQSHLESVMTEKPDYNDGTWHGWNGGECPVHPESLVDIGYRGIPGAGAIKAGELDWGHEKAANDIIAFRVVWVRREPRKFWLFRNLELEPFAVCSSLPHLPWLEVIEVQEVLK